MACSGHGIRPCPVGTSDSCNTSNGACVFNAAAQNGVGCNADDSVCTTNDVCSSGTCTPGPSLNCNDSNGCTTDGCTATDGCNHPANNNACNDSNACTGPDVCAGGACAPATLNCDDSNPCTTDSCNTATGCVHGNLPDKTTCNGTGLCSVGVCVPGKCGDTVIQAALGEQCDDGNATSLDGCSSTCKVEDLACADGTRDGLLDAVTYPNIAMCNGNWTGWIGATGAGTAAALCGSQFHACTYGDTALMKSISQAIAFSTGCWAANASNQGNLCQACGNGDQKEMAGVGSSCQGKIANSGTSCIAEAYRIDASVKTCVRTATNMPWVNGLMCCKN